MKDERLEQFKQQLESWQSDLSLTLQSIKDRLVTAFSRGYDEGFADGVVAGQKHLAQAQEMINGVLAK